MSRAPANALTDAPSTGPRLCWWRHAHGERTPFFVLSIADAQKLQAPGVYILASAGIGGDYMAHYIGEADNIGAQLRQHGLVQAAMRAGASQIHVNLTSKTHLSRILVEQALIATHAPALNIARALAPDRLAG